METIKEKKYSEEFKRKAIELAQEIGTKEAVEKLGLSSSQQIGSWKRFLMPERRSYVSKD